MCSLKIPIENLKCTNWYELEEQGTVVAKVLISYLIDEKGEISNHSRTLHNLDLQREQVRYLKKKYFLNKVREQFENSVSFQKIAKERMDVQMGIKKLKEEHSDIKNQLNLISVGYVKRHSTEVLPRHFSRILNKSINNC